MMGKFIRSTLSTDWKLVFPRVRTTISALGARRFIEKAWEEFSAPGPSDPSDAVYGPESFSR
jgi:hypothetical protein